MSDADFGPSLSGQANGIDWNNADRTVGMVNFQDRNAHAIFYTDKMPNPAKSREAGRPIYDNVVMIRIGNPGERLNVVVRPVREEDKRRFAIQWAQFMQSHKQRPEGTPLSFLLPENPAAIGMLEGCNVHTVEQLASLSGEAIQTIGMGAQGYVNSAQQYLTNAEKGIRNSQMRTLQEDHKRETDQLKFQISELQKTVEKLVQQQRNAILRQDQVDLAGSMERPVHLGQGFDAQAEQIAALDRQNRQPAKPPVRQRRALRA